MANDVEKICTCQISMVICQNPRGLATEFIWNQQLHEWRITMKTMAWAKHCKGQHKQTWKIITLSKPRDATWKWIGSRFCPVFKEHSQNVGVFMQAGLLPAHKCLMLRNTWGWGGWGGVQWHRWSCTHVRCYGTRGVGGGWCGVGVMTSLKLHTC